MLNVILILGMILNLGTGLLLIAGLESAVHPRRDPRGSGGGLQWDHSFLYLQEAAECRGDSQEE